MEAITKKGKRLFENVKQGVKTTVTETGSFVSVFRNTTCMQ